MLSGSLDDFTLPEVLRMLSLLKKSGTLSVTRRAGAGRIDFRDGDVVYAETELAKSHLGQRLVSSGKITDVQLRQSLDVQATTGDKLGRILQVSETISEDDLREAIKGQIEDSAFELMCWEAGEFSWSAGDPEPSEVDIALGVDDLVAAAQGRIERRNAMQETISSPRAVPRLAEQAPAGTAAINITGAQWRVLVLVDGVRDVAAIAARAEVEREEMERMLLELASAGLIEVEKEAPVAEEAPGPVPEAPDKPPQENEAISVPETSPAPRTAAPSLGRPQGESPPDEWFEDPVEAENDEVVPESVGFPTGPAPVPTVERAAAVRELSGLFNDREGVEEPEPDPEAVTATRGTTPPPPPKGRLSRWSRRAPRG